MSSRRLRIAARRRDILARSELLRGQLDEESAAIRRHLEVGARVVALVPLLRSLIARFRR